MLSPGHEKIVKMLVENGSDVNAVETKNGDSPLHMAAELGNHC